jgi:SAM-dependent methyltransferase
LAAQQGDFNPFSDDGWQQLARCFHHAIRHHRVPRVLDIGCGTGQSYRVYAGRAEAYVGIDLSLGGLKLAKHAVPAPFACADANRLPFSGGAFDVVAFSGVLHHIPNRRPAMEEAMRVLRPGGVAFAYDPNLLHPAMALFRHPRSPFFLSAGVSPNERPVLPRELSVDFRAAGFVEIQQRGQAGVPYRHVAPRAINALLSFYNAADRVLQSSGLDRWFGPLVITVARRPP